MVIKPEGTVMSINFNICLSMIEDDSNVFKLLYSTEAFSVLQV
jgi:hypothetical protein